MSSLEVQIAAKPCWHITTINCKTLCTACLMPIVSQVWSHSTGVHSKQHCLVYAIVTDFPSGGFDHCIAMYVHGRAKMTCTTSVQLLTPFYYLTLLDMDIFSIGMGCDLIIFCEKRNFRHICYKHQLLQ